MLKKREIRMFALSVAVLFYAALVVDLIRVGDDGRNFLPQYFSWLDVVIFLLGPAGVAIGIFRTSFKFKRFGKPTYTLGKPGDYRLEYILVFIYLSAIVCTSVFMEPGLRHLSFLLQLGLCLLLVEIESGNAGFSDNGIFWRGRFLGWDAITDSRMEETKNRKRWKIMLTTYSEEFNKDYEFPLLATAEEKDVLFPFVQKKTKPNDTY